MKAVHIIISVLLIIILAGCSGGGSAPPTSLPNPPPPPPPPPATLQSIIIDNLADNIVQGTQAQLSLVGEFSDSTQETISTGITWSSSDESVVTISTSGLVNAVAPGSATISASASGFSVSTEVTIEAPTLTAIQLSSALTSLALGLDTQINGTGTFNNGVSSALENIQFSSSDETIATVSEQGAVSTLKEGTVIITGELAGISDTIELTITEAELLSFNIQLDDLSIADGTSTVAFAIGTFTDSSSSPIAVIWQSSDETIATISEQGVIEALGVGQVQITALFDDVQADPILLEVTNAIAVGLSPISNASIALGLNAQRSAVLLFSNDTVQAATDVQWSSSDTNIVSLTVNNEVARLQANMTGSVTVTAEVQGFSTSFTVNVTQAVVQSVALSQSDINLPVGVSTNVSLFANLSDGSQTNVTNNASFAVTPSNIASVGSAQNQEVSITAEEIGIAELTGTFQGFTANANVTVTDAEATGLVIESGQTSQLPLGLSRQLEVKVEYSDGSRLAQDTGINWQVSDSNIGSISADGSSVAQVSGSQIGSFSVNVSYLSFSTSFEITITDTQPESLSITVPTVFLDDTSKRATAEFTFTDNSTGDATDAVVWSVDDTGIATVENSSSNEGLINPQSLGSTVIRASYNGGELTDSASLDVQPIQLEKGFRLLNYGPPSNVTLGTEDAQTTVQFTQVSGTSINIEVLNGGEVALASGVTDFTSVTQADAYTFSTGPLTLTQNGTQSIAVLKNANGFFGLLQVHEVRLQDTDAESSQVAFSWTIRVDGEDNFSNYIVENQLKILTCFFAECTDGDLPRFLGTSIERNENPKPAQFELVKFVLISIGRDYTVINLRANDLNNISTMSFDGLIDNQMIPKGHAVPFRLLSTPTNGQDASMDYFFEIEGLSDLTFNFQGRLTTN